MPDIDKNVAAGEGADKGAGTGEGQDKGADHKENANETKTGNEDAGAGAGEGGDNKGDTNADASKKGEGEGKDAKAPKDGSQQGDSDDDGKDDGKEPDTRKRLSTKDFIVGRQRAKIAKSAKAGEGDGKEGKDGEGADGDGDVAPEDEELINKVVAKNFAPILDKTISAEDDKEVAVFLKENPDFAPFEAKARRYIAHPSRRHLPIEAIFYEVAGNKLLKIGAERQKKADEEANKTQTGGGSSRAGEGGKSVWDLTPDEFAAEQEKIRRGN